MENICLGCKIIWLRYLVLGFTVIVSLFFGAPASALCFIHMKNYARGQTTNERYSRKVKTPSEVGSESDEDIEETHKGCCRNCLVMCCFKKSETQEQLLLQYLND